MATTSATIPALAEQLRVALARVNRRLRQEAGGEIGPTLTAALATISRHGPITPSELANRERVQRPTATRLVAKLEDRGLLSRAADPGDARSSLLSITPEGEALLGEMRRHKDAFLAQRLRTLSAGDRATLARAADLLEQLL